LLLPLDIGIRRLMLRRSDVGAATAWLRTARLMPEAAARPGETRAPKPPRDAPAEQIERLRAAKARARRKARGEETPPDEQL
jgi:hypothetical protein